MVRVFPPVEVFETPGLVLELFDMRLASDELREGLWPVSLNQKDWRVCPVGSEKFIGSPSQYVYAFNPPLPNGLQLSGL